VLTQVPGASPSSPPAEVVVFGTNHFSKAIADDVYRAIMGEPTCRMKGWEPTPPATHHQRSPFISFFHLPPTLNPKP
jgi:hypothetical protein